MRFCTQYLYFYTTEGAKSPDEASQDHCNEMAYIITPDLAEEIVNASLHVSGVTICSIWKHDKTSGNTAFIYRLELRMSFQEKPIVTGKV